MSNTSTQESMADRCYRLIREAIIFGEMAPGASFNESALVQKFEVSTSPLREALTRLRQDGLVRVLPRKGYVVTELTLSDFHDLVQMRFVLEGTAAELAAPRTTQKDLDLLRSLAATTFVPGDLNSIRAFMNAHQEFHLHIGEMSGNRRLSMLIEQSYFDIQRLLFANFGNGEGAIGEGDHDAIIEALARRDPEAARQATIEHIRESRDRALNRLVRDTDSVATHSLRT